MRTRLAIGGAEELTSRRATAADAEIGARVRRQRELRDVTQLSLAEMLGMSLQQIQKYEAGDTRLPASRVLEIADRLGINVTDLMVDPSSAGSHTASAEALGRGKAAAELVELITAFTEISSAEGRAKVVEMARFVSALERNRV